MISQWHTGEAIHAANDIEFSYDFQLQVLLS